MGGKKDELFYIAMGLLYSMGHNAPVSIVCDSDNGTGPEVSVNTAGTYSKFALGHSKLLTLR